MYHLATKKLSQADRQTDGQTDDIPYLHGINISQKLQNLYVFLPEEKHTNSVIFG